MKKDTFWKWFWVFGLGLFVIGFVGTSSLYAYELSRVNTAAVAVSFDPNKDPFLFAMADRSTPVVLDNGYLYQDGLLLRFQSWNWHAATDWHSAEQVSEGVYDLKITFDEAGGTAGMNGPAIPLGTYQSLSLMVMPDATVGDLYIELYDKAGNSLGIQSIGWYAPSSSLVADKWQEVTIPLANIASSARSISGFSISSRHAGVAHIDAIKLKKDPATHSLWVQPPEVDTPVNPLLGVVPVAMPYTLSFGSDELAKWYTYYGAFKLQNGSLLVGPSSVASTTGSLSIFRGGRDWKDYRVDSVVYWGATSVYSMIARFQDDKNYVECAVSLYGESAALYQIKNGVSTELARSPGLAVPVEEGWVNVPMSIQVVGNTVSCYVRGDKVLSMKVTSIPNQGSVGFETWDPNAYSSSHSVKSFSVTPMTSE